MNLLVLFLCALLIVAFCILGWKYFDTQDKTASEHKSKRKVVALLLAGCIATMFSLPQIILNFILPVSPFRLLRILLLPQPFPLGVVNDFIQIIQQPNGSSRNR